VERVTWVVRALLELILTGMMVWYMLPTHQRREMLMRLAQQGQRSASWAARRTGARAIRRELAGDVAGAQGDYDLAHRIMTGPVEAAGRWYESLRSAH
jgi:uncharacterized protein HemY